MKTLIFVFFLSLLLVSPAISQEGRVFYNVCQSNAETIRDFQRDKITVNTLDSASIVFVSDIRPYSAKSIAGYDFLEGGKDTPQHFYARKVDNNSFFIASDDITAFAYYHTDRRKADESDNTSRCAVNDLNSFESSVKSFLTKEKEMGKEKEKEAKKVFDSQTQGVITDWIKNYKSKKVDPTLEKGILAWWKGSSGAVVINPILHIYFLQPDFTYSRNEFGIVLNKTVDTLYVFKMKNDGKCYAAWRSFGYESLGGGSFAGEVKDWVHRNNAGYPDIIRMAGDREIDAGSQHEVDCAPFVKAGS